LGGGCFKIGPRSPTRGPLKANAGIQCCATNLGAPTVTYHRLLLGGGCFLVGPRIYLKTGILFCAINLNTSPIIPWDHHGALFLNSLSHFQIDGFTLLTNQQWRGYKSQG
jgi:hypothetical protein